MSNELLALAYEDVDPAKSLRLRDCATSLIYTVQPNGRKRLKHANFCRVRLCPICQWRRSLKTFAHMSHIMAAVEDDRPRGYIFVTLTVKNCSGDDLGHTLDNLTSGFTRLMNYARVNKAVKGWYRGIEITHNLTMDTYHPHIHMVCAVNKSYFKNAEYIKQREWTSLWRKAARLSYDPRVDVRRIKGNDPGAVAEVAKYSVTSDGYIIPDDWDMTIDTVRLLDTTLDHRRFIAYGGIFKEWHKRLNLDDEQDGDLVHTDEKAISVDGPEVYFTWSTGYRQYIQQP